MVHGEVQDGESGDGDGDGGTTQDDGSKIWHLTFWSTMLTSGLPPGCQSVLSVGSENVIEHGSSSFFQVGHWDSEREPALNEMRPIHCSNFVAGLES